MIPHQVSKIVSKPEKLLEGMRRNPAGDWTIQDVQTLCKGLGWQCLPPTGGVSHFKIAVPGSETILTIPAKRPIKPVYIRKLMECVKGSANGPETEDAE